MVRRSFREGGRPAAPHVGTQDSPKIIDQHEIGIEPDHLCCQCPAPITRHCHVRVDPRYPKSELAYPVHPLIAEPIHLNAPNNPIRTWIINDGVNPVVTVHSPDIGLLLNRHPPSPPPTVIPRAFFANLFKIPTLWGVKDTAPYFHYNGAKTLRDAVAHYKRFFNFTEAQDPVGSASLGGFIVLTDDEVDDIVAYLQLLGPTRR